MSLNFNMTELCSLIKECASSGVSELTLEPFRVVFSEQKKEATTTPPAYFYAQTSVEQDRQKLDDDEVLLKEELRLREDQLSNALLEDPAEFERLLMAGELEDDPTQH
jgi:hypothetical protein